MATIRKNIVTIAFSTLEYHVTIDTPLDPLIFRKNYPNIHKSSIPPSSPTARLEIDRKSKKYHRNFVQHPRMCNNQKHTRLSFFTKMIRKFTNIIDTPSSPSASLTNRLESKKISSKPCSAPSNMSRNLSQNSPIHKFIGLDYAITNTTCSTYSFSVRNLPPPPPQLL